ncbi:MAG TPA: hypothetical protein VGO94_15745 [Mycobacteriales bacterium]|nr:hypothetical protein [Mycobacteriales bacterium]
MGALLLTQVGGVTSAFAAVAVAGLGSSAAWPATSAPGHGETLWSPTGNALLNDLAPPHLRGRYHALGSLTWQLAMIAGPVMPGLLLDAGHTGAEVGVLLLAGAAVVALARALERRLTPAQNGIAGDVPRRPYRRSPPHPDRKGQEAAGRRRGAGQQSSGHRS